MHLCIRLNGATTFIIMTLNITTFRTLNLIVTPSIMTLHNVHAVIVQAVIMLDVVAPVKGMRQSKHRLLIFSNLLCMF